MRSGLTGRCTSCCHNDTKICFVHAPGHLYLRHPFPGRDVEVQGRGCTIGRCKDFESSRQNPQISRVRPLAESDLTLHSLSPILMSVSLRHRAMQYLHG